jgi:hypothetical protein
MFVRPYRHNLKAHVLEFPAGLSAKAIIWKRRLFASWKEETGYTLAAGAELRAEGAYYSPSSETSKYTHIFLAAPVAQTGLAQLDSEIEKYFDMSVVVMPLVQALEGIGTVITSMETASSADSGPRRTPGARPGRHGFDPITTARDRGAEVRRERIVSEPVSKLTGPRISGWRTDVQAGQPGVFSPCCPAVFLGRRQAGQPLP